MSNSDELLKKYIKTDSTLTRLKKHMTFSYIQGKSRIHNGNGFLFSVKQQFYSSSSTILTARPM